ncbi:SAM-dependent methyltransferase [Amycolatopsis sp. PS_44_ISF1]|uniref:SAM-dependent methyltransferase n=1 Tax=Amycolatopsis sp. PS_44_ISF1 TaxID=2974917 RepID=UPI0028DF6B37|nr:SAM-dependent methyltransferase [Amycolatopsis sp. PS_44_ISF1]MDT8913024.1 SAM-dependent methyltransferase [Amycolatopsis sp. PS_44_ISF1]
MSGETGAPPGVDPGTPSVARVYDHLLGGKDNYEVDRRQADAIKQHMPEVADVAWQNRNFLIRLCRFLADSAGVTQYLDCGSGLPTAENVHQVVQRVHQEAKVAYVDYDPVVAAHGRALLDENEHTEYLQADFFDPPSILEAEVVRRHLDWDRPIAVLFLAALHHNAGEGSRAAEVTRAFAERLPSGSYLAISHVLDPGDGSEDDRILQETLREIRNGPMKTITARTAAEILELVHGWEVIPPGPGRPGEVTAVSDWWPDGPMLGRPSIAQRILGCVVARKP